MERKITSIHNKSDQFSLLFAERSNNVITFEPIGNLSNDLRLSILKILSQI